ncbi:MAG: hypothetical protein IPP80_08575 [Ignavibacteria bacterium]|nr:hypothetical protein [Ignavibacteria bacterium]
MRFARLLPDSVVSIANDCRRLTKSSIVSIVILPARMSPWSIGTSINDAAMSSAFTNTSHSGIDARYRRANVVFPTPLGPAMMMMKGARTYLTCAGTPRT